MGRGMLAFRLLVLAGLATCALSVAVPVTDKKVVLGVQVTMKSGVMEECPKDAGGLDELHAFVGGTLLHLLTVKGIKGKVKAGVIKCTSGAAEEADSESYASTASSSSSSAAEEDAKRVVLTFAATVESKTHTAAVHTLVKQLEELGARGHNTCHVKGVECASTDVAALDISAAQPLAKGEAAKLHKVKPSALPASQKQQQHGAKGADSDDDGEDKDAGGAYNSVDADDSADADRDADAGADDAAEYAPSSKSHKRGGGKKGLTHEQIKQHKADRHEHIVRHKEAIAAKKAAKGGGKKGGGKKKGWHAKRGGHGHGKKASAAEDGGDSDASSEPTHTTVDYMAAASVAPLAPAFGGFASAARLAAPQYQAGTAATAAAMAQQQQQQLLVAPGSGAPSSSSALLVPAVVPVSYALEPGYVITEEVLMTAKQYEASNEQPAAGTATVVQPAAAAGGYVVQQQQPQAQQQLVQVQQPLQAQQLLVQP